jgi:Zn-dependent protease
MLKNKWVLCILTAILSIICYKFVFGWELSFWFVILLGIHEAGHYIMAKKEKVHVSVPIFIPFVGAIINLKEHVSMTKDCLIGLGGPLFGIIGCIIADIIGHILNVPVLIKVSGIMFFVNLINLTPYYPLDGGRICVLFDKYIKYVGILMLILLNFLFHSPVFIIMSILLFMQNRGYEKNKQRNDYMNLMNYKYMVDDTKNLKNIMMSIYTLLVFTCLTGIILK